MQLKINYKIKNISRAKFAIKYGFVSFICPDATVDLIK